MVSFFLLISIISCSLTFFFGFSAQTIPYWIPLIAGMSARVTSVTIVNPLELIRTKMQSQKLNYNEVGRALKEMINFYGISGLYKGLGPTLLRDVPFSGIYWVSYETLKKKFEVTNPTFSFSFLAGGLSGCVSFFCFFFIILFLVCMNMATEPEPEKLTKHVTKWSPL